MFDLDKKTATLQHINIRDEKHGEENVLAVDLKFSADFDGDILAEFGSALRHSMYEKDTAGDLADQGSDTPTKLRFPQMAQPLKFCHEIIGASVDVAYGIGSVTLDTVDVNGFKVECHNGGTVGVTWRIQAKPSAEQLGKLSMLLGGPVEISITPPETLQ
jgi:hypothetical protein